jgi:hypothetical protein
MNLQHRSFQHQHKQRARFGQHFHDLLSMRELMVNLHAIIKKKQQRNLYRKQLG